MEKLKWKLLKEGNEETFKEFYEEYADMLYGYGMKLTQNNVDLVTECIQLLFVQIYERRQRLAIPDNVTAYMLISLKRLLYKEQNNRRNFISIGPEEGNQEEFFRILIDMNEVRGGSALREKQFVALQKALDTLSPQQREVIYLRYYRELSVEEVANALDLSHQTVKNVAHTAIKKLRENDLLKETLSMGCGLLGIWLFLNNYKC